MRFSLYAAKVAMTLLLAACSWGDALESDPTAWHPAPGPVSTAATNHRDAGDEHPPEPPECSALPELDLRLKVSSGSLRSHRSGEPCLAGCHEPGGTATLAFAAAGSAYGAQYEHRPAQAGKVVEGIGGTRLTVDVCGNFYAIESALKSSAQNTQPWLKDPTFHRMEKPLARVARAGDCNQAGCHDFGGRLNSGIYF